MAIILPMRVSMGITAAFLAFAVGACATTTPECQKEIDACLARCHRTGADDNPPQQRNDSPEFSMTYCEEHCHCGPQAPPSSSSSAPPTYTGNAQ